MKRIVIIMSVILILVALGVFAVILVRQRGLVSAPPDVPSSQAPTDGTSSLPGQPSRPAGDVSAPAAASAATGIVPPGEDAPPPLSEAALTDADGDGLSDEEEAALGTDPAKADTDGDSLRDGDEVRIYCTDPKDPSTDGNQTDEAWVQSRVVEASEKGQRPQFCVN